ncbi:transglutaminase TgpA family protein [Microbulbifer sp. YPW16]|uniref:transglutaminase TgpA family protein n=1 Tax=Microbulbifer sp. YPW16 TaxID=2904242 RepID=UPI001E47BE6B|nr:DUF3488 and transglutaminase-like domain-containing protein [Microbulbifer sp. YPW16]UHQ55022.1 DUF3488 and transglutaminase-like domain-containing protein [Microbulbifer sp. YPW16]
MAYSGRLPRESLLWIFAAQFAVLLPHFARLPLWIVAGWVLAAWWRAEVSRGRRELPGRMIKLVAVALVVGGLVLSYGHWFALEPMVALLAVSFTLKNLELVTRRDAFLSLLLAYFVAATLFIFDQGIPHAIYGVLAVLVVTAALVAQAGAGSARPRRALGLSARLLAQSVPLMLLLFLVMPRLGPLWAVPQEDASATTGVSDSMSPGDFANLSKSDKPALRITFDGPVPPPEQRYWRGLVYADFDGRRWSQGFGVDPREGGQVFWRDNEVALPEVGPRYRYQVIQEPTRSQWLFAMARPHSATDGVGETRDDRLVRSEPVFSRLAYEVRSWPRDSINEVTPMGDFDRRRNLQLPDGGNPRAREWAARLRAQGLSPSETSDAVLSFFNQQFTYTLAPPSLGADTVDGFLYDTQRGFCEHFAGSYVFMMRAAGIPARVVAGYQGGEWVEGEEYLLVRQYDAHAWAEIWTGERGWQRVDPTAAVAPERVRNGLQTAAADEFMRDALVPLHRFPVLKRLQLQWDMINYRWYRTVVGFDSQRQQDLLRELLGQVTSARLALLVALPAVGALLGIWAWLWFSGRGRRAPPAARLYRRFCRRLARYGVERRPGEAPADFAARVGRELPHLGPMARSITTAYQRAAYADDPAALVQLRRLLRGFWPRLRRGPAPGQG